MTPLSALSHDALQRSTVSRWLSLNQVVFRRFGPELIAFRQLGTYGFFRPRAPLVRGVIRREAGASSIAVIGYMTWYNTVGLALVLVWAYFSPWILALAVVGYGAHCWMDIARFRRVAAAVAEGASAPVAHHDPQLA